MLTSGGARAAPAVLTQNGLSPDELAGGLVSSQLAGVGMASPLLFLPLPLVLESL